jgi:hypothetical protein
MSDQQGAPPPNPDRPGMGCGSVLMILVGVILLLPGLCALLFLQDAGHDPGLLSLLFICLLIGAGGIALIVWAFKR